MINFQSSKQVLRRLSQLQKKHIGYVHPEVKRYSRGVIFEEIERFGKKHDAVYFGQGFPDWEAPKFVKMAMIEAIQNQQNQYCRVQGLPMLCEEAAEYYTKELGREINPMENVVVLSGATSVLSAAISSYIK